LRAISRTNAEVLANAGGATVWTAMTVARVKAKLAEHLAQSPVIGSFSI
jgi:hypothetical protein